MVLTNKVLIPAEGTGSVWGDTGYCWVHNQPELAEMHDPFLWLHEHAQGAWRWEMLGNMKLPYPEVLNINNYYRINDSHFCFYFELASDAVLFKLTWS